MIKLSKRLMAIASFVKKDAKIVDIGCDHALLDIYLVSTHPNLKAIAIDIREGALKQAKLNVVKYGVQDKIKLILADGLDSISSNEIDTIIISGLGGNKIVEILKSDKNKLFDVEDIIIQPNVDYFFARKEICKLGYYIANETLVKENNIIYIIIHFKKGKHTYYIDDYLLGPCLRKEKNNLFIELITNEIRKKEILYNSIPHQYFVKRRQLKTYINKLKTYIK